jgi:hypothetical protein
MRNQRTESDVSRSEQQGEVYVTERPRELYLGLNDGERCTWDRTTGRGLDDRGRCMHDRMSNRGV